MDAYPPNNPTLDASRIDWGAISMLIGNRSLDEPRRIPVHPYVSNPQGLSRLDLLKEVIIWGQVPLILLYKFLASVRSTGFTLKENETISDSDFQAVSELFYEVFSVIPRVEGKLNFEITPDENSFFRYKPYGIHLSATEILRDGTSPQYPPRFRDSILAGGLYHELFHATGLIRLSPVDELLNLLIEEEGAIYYIIRDEVTAHAFSRATEDVFYGMPPFSSDRLHEFDDMSPEYYYHVMFSSPEAYPISLQRRIRVARRAYRMLVPVYYRIIAETLNIDAIFKLSDTWN